MKHKKDIILFMITLLLVFALRYTYMYDISKKISISTAHFSTTTTTTATTITPTVSVLKSTIHEKRGNPTYDYIIGTDNWAHYRVFFWVPKDAYNLIPYADPGIVTDVSEHGPAAKWSVVTTEKVNKDEKLVFIYVPKTFIFFQGNGFEKVIHLKYQTIIK